MRKILLGLLVTILSSHALATEPRFMTQLSCQLGDSQSVISLLRGHPLSGTDVYRVRLPDAAGFLYEDADASRGSNVQSRCVPLKEGSRVLLVSGEFTSNYLQGVLFYLDLVDHKIGRIEFAERNRPGWIWLTEQGPQVIFANVGHESSHKYLIYGPNDRYQETDEFPAHSHVKNETLVTLKL